LLYATSYVPRGAGLVASGGARERAAARPRTRGARARAPALLVA
jgi:hypothetical protein